MQKSMGIHTKVRVSLNPEPLRGIFIEHGDEKKRLHLQPERIQGKQ